MSSDKFLLVDGHNLLFQMFYGMPHRFQNSKGQYIHAVVGFIGALNKIIHWTKPTHLLVVFDGEIQNARCLENEAYKKNRIDYSVVEEIDNPFVQLPLIKECLDVMGIIYYETQTCEADDVIASYILKYKKHCEIVLSSYDSDFFQLLSPGVQILRYRGKSTTLIDSQVFADKYGIAPQSYVFYKSMVGDPADNIKGIYGVGPKTAKKIIEKYQSLEKLYDDIPHEENQKLREKLLFSKALLQSNERLIRLSEGKIPYLLEQLTFVSLEKKTLEILQMLDIK